MPRPRRAAAAPGAPAPVARRAPSGGLVHADAQPSPTPRRRRPGSQTLATAGPARAAARSMARRPTARATDELAPGAEVCLPGTGRALFRAGKLLGRGGFGEVYRRRAVGGAARRRALKRVRYSNFDAAKRDDVERQHCDEALLMLQLGAHPNIVALHYCVVSDGDEFLMFLTLVDGAKSLDDAITAARRCTRARSARRGGASRASSSTSPPRSRFCRARRAPPGREAGERARRRRRFGQAHGLWVGDQGRGRRRRAARRGYGSHARVRVARGARARRALCSRPSATTRPTRR